MLARPGGVKMEECIYRCVPDLNRLLHCQRIHCPVKKGIFRICRIPYDIFTILIIYNIFSKKRESKSKMAQPT